MHKETVTTEETQEKSPSTEVAPIHHNNSKEPSPKKEATNLSMESFQSQFDALSTLEEKLQLSINFMTEMLSQHGSPQFKNFWEIRRKCLPMFKENINPALRVKLWTEFSNLSKEARKLKEILDEQSEFAVEQIGIAIGSLEEEISTFPTLLQKTGDLTFPIETESLKSKIPTYATIQKELNILNAFAVRINSLRKELIRTEMRIRFKNKFFHRLSALGDQIFPKRKESIKKISQLFIEDIELFIKEHFSTEEFQSSLFFLREEIKALQGIAKTLTLNTHSFTQTRSKLSECWDRVKSLEKDRKKERTQKRALHKENSLSVEKRINDFTDSFNPEESSVQESHKTLDEISEFMKNVELGRQEVQSLKEQLQAARKLIKSKEELEEQERLKKEAEAEKARKEKVDALRGEIKTLIEKAPELTHEQLSTEKDQLKEKISHAPFLKKAEKQQLESNCRPFRELIAEKKEQALLAMSDDDREVLNSLSALLNQRLERRQEIKEQLEVYRKAVGSSGLDFQKAMSFNEMIQEEKEILSANEEKIKEIELKIQQIKENI